MSKRALFHKVKKSNISKFNGAVTSSWFYKVNDRLGREEFSKAYDEAIERLSKASDYDKAYKDEISHLLSMTSIISPVFDNLYSTRTHFHDVFEYGFTEINKKFTFNETKPLEYLISMKDEFVKNYSRPIVLDCNDLDDVYIYFIGFMRFKWLSVVEKDVISQILASCKNGAKNPNFCKDVYQSRRLDYIAKLMEYLLENLEDDEVYYVKFI